MAESAPDFERPNLGSGPDPLSLSALADRHDVALLLLQRDQYCTNCRAQVQAVAERYAEFRERGAEVVSVVPESPDRVESWQARYELPFPLLADPDASVGEGYHQPVRFGFLGERFDFVGRMPAAIVIDLRETPTVAWRHRGSSTFDRPSIDDLLRAIDEVTAQ